MKLERWWHSRCQMHPDAKWKVKRYGTRASRIPVRSQAITFDTIKACYPFTIKCELFSLLCYQPQAFPASSTTLKAPTARSPRCWHLIWNGQAKAQCPNRFTPSPAGTRSSRLAMLQRASPPERHQQIVHRFIYKLDNLIIINYLWVI